MERAERRSDGGLMSDLAPQAPGLWLFPASRVFQGNVGLRELYAARLQGRREPPDLVARRHSAGNLP